MSMTKFSQAVMTDYIEKCLELCTFGGVAQDKSLCVVVGFRTTVRSGDVG